MIKIFADAEQLNRFAAEKFVEIAVEAVEKNGSCVVALAGGSTPKAFYQLLASEKYKNEIDWTKTIFFFGDERNVAPDSDESNFRMANENLFAPLKINDANIFRWQTELKDAKKIAGDYEDSIKAFFALFEKEFPKFDLILLGMGDDGHTASLFPHTEALREKDKIAVANPVGKLNTTRLTLTFPAINNARNVIFLVKGADKAATVRAVLQEDLQPEKFPSQAISPTNGELWWLIEKDAARFLQ